MLKYQNKRVIITGGSSGIGKATAKLLAQQGADIAIIARDRLRLNAAQQEIAAAKIIPTQKIVTLVADVAQKTEITEAITKAIAHLGTPDLLITAAGIAYPGYFLDIPLEVFEQTMQINYFGSLYRVRAVLPAMIQQQRGHIVFIASGAGLVGIYGYSAYSPSKFALRGLGESLRGELRPQGIKVSVVYPPDTDTPQLAAESKTKPPETKQITGTAKIWSAEAVAKSIIRGIDKQQIAIAPGWEMNFLNKFHSLLMPVLNRYFDRIIDRVRRDNYQ